MWSPGSSSTRHPMRVIKHASIEHCASTCRGRQTGGSGLGREGFRRLPILAVGQLHGRCGEFLPSSGCVLNADNELLPEPYESPMIARTDWDRLTPPELLQHAHISRWCQ